MKVDEGLSPLFIIFVVFLVLKLLDVITWSWWFVSAPLWIPFLLGCAVFLFAVFSASILRMINRKRSKKLKEKKSAS